MKQYSKYIFFLLLGIVISTGVQIVLAHGGNTNFIHACVGTGVLNQGRIRIIAASGTCNANESPLDWTKVPWNSDFPLICQDCNLDHNTVGDLFVGKDLSNAHLENARLMGNDFTTSILTTAHFSGAVLTDANLQGLDLSNQQLPGTTFTSANLSNVNFSGTDLSGSILANSNLSSANFSSATLSGATGFDTATRTGIIYNNTICPDGTNSDNNGDTCEGHLTP